MQDNKASVKFIEKCYKLYEQKLYQVAYRILRDEGQAEDAVQEAFLKLMKSDAYFADVESDDCKRYIITVIKNASFNIYNKRKREQEVIYLSDYTDLNEIEDIKEDNSDIEDIKDLMVNLPEKYYDVVDCLVVKDMSVKETAIELNISEANVRKRFERAKLLLKTVLKGREQYETNGRLYKSGII